MEIDKLFDVPAHPLFVHVPVVFTPLAALGLLLVVIRPSWRVRFGWLVVAFAAVAAIGAQLAAGSGKKLEKRIDKNDAIQRHIDLSGTARPLVFVFFGLALLYVALPWWLDRQGRTTAVAEPADGGIAVRVREQAPAWSRPVIAVLAVLSVVSAGLATTWIIRAGHQGSKAVWQSTGERTGDNRGEGGG
jgi:hypothetical protein